MAIENNVSRIFFIYPNGNIYSIGITDFLNNSIKWKNNEGNYVRSIPVSLLTRENGIKQGTS